jgi:alpha-galactosidase
MQQIHRERVSTRQSISNTVFRRQLNGRAFLNDPDVFFLREENTKLSQEEKRYLATANTLLGNVWLTSDDMGSYDARQAEQWRELRALRGAKVLSVDAGEEVRVTYLFNGEEKTEVILPSPAKKKKS